MNTLTPIDKTLLAILADSLVYCPTRYQSFIGSTKISHDSKNLDPFFKSIETHFKNKTDLNKIMCNLKCSEQPVDAQLYKLLLWAQERANYYPGEKAVL